MTSEQRTLLSMRAMDKKFAGIPALTGASLEVLPAEVHALIGQNGAGKSTMIKILTGAYEKDAGDVELRWRAIRRQPRRRRPSGTGSARSTRKSTWSPTAR